MENMDAVRKLSEILSQSRKLVVFTGAGISVPSGIPDFRSADGLYMQKEFDGASPEEIISHSYFLAHTKQFYRFYREKMLYPDAKPNAAHQWIASLEHSLRDVNVVTQNIDGLHEAAGSAHVCLLHGTVHRNFCMHCGRQYDLSALLSQASKDGDGIPRCPYDGAVIKPDVVLYEEPLHEDIVDDAVSSIASADTMLIIGTSLVVYPAASYVRCFRGKHLVLINKTETPYDHMAELSVYDDIVHVVKMLESLQNES